MWRKYKIHEGLLPYPKRINSAFLFLTVADMKTILKTNKIKPRLSPKKRVEFEEAIKSFLSLKDIKPYVNEIVDSRRTKYEDLMEIAKCKLLIHTIFMTMSSMNSKLGYKNIDIPLKFEAWDRGCQVEEKYAKKYNKGELNGLPPFFPGDRTMLVADVDE